MTGSVLVCQEESTITTKQGHRTYSLLKDDEYGTEYLHIDKKDGKQLSSIIVPLAELEEFLGIEEE